MVGVCFGCYFCWEMIKAEEGLACALTMTEAASQTPFWKDSTALLVHAAVVIRCLFCMCFFLC